MAPVNHNPAAKPSIGAGGPELWHRDLLAAGVREIPVNSETAMLAASLHANHGIHSDPADQLVTASAMVAKRPLVTSDRRILDWASERATPECLDASA